MSCDAAQKLFLRRGHERKISWAKGQNWAKSGKIPDFEQPELNYLSK